MKPKLVGLVILALIMALAWALDSSNSTSLYDAGPGQTSSSVVAPSADIDTDSRSDLESTAQDPPEQTEQASSPLPNFSDLPPIERSELPPEALDTLDDIANGGPYDFSRDDSVFQNREGFLPDRPRGHYREYTVITPGSDDRGARRIVAGADGELYYTFDHYNSFHEIRPER